MIIRIIIIAARVEHVTDDTESRLETQLILATVKYSSFKLSRSA